MGCAVTPPTPLKLVWFTTVVLLITVRFDVDVPHHRRVHVHHRGVVAEDPASPHAADETDAAVAKSVINAAVEADVRTPVACMPAVQAARKAPIARRPQHAHVAAASPTRQEPSSSQPGRRPSIPESRDIHPGTRRLRRRPATQAVPPGSRWPLVQRMPLVRDTEKATTGDSEVFPKFPWRKPPWTDLLQSEIGHPTEKRFDADNSVPAELRLIVIINAATPKYNETSLFPINTSNPEMLCTVNCLSTFL